MCILLTVTTICSALIYRDKHISPPASKLLHSQVQSLYGGMTAPERKGLYHLGVLGAQPEGVREGRVFIAADGLVMLRLEAEVDWDQPFIITFYASLTFLMPDHT